LIKPKRVDDKTDNEWRRRLVSQGHVNRSHSFDHLVGERQQGRGHGNAERSGGLEVDHQSKLARLLNRKIAGLGTDKYFRGVAPA
jgi:hypothetical protein